MRFLLLSLFLAAACGPQIAPELPEPSPESGESGGAAACRALSELVYESTDCTGPALLRGVQAGERVFTVSPRGEPSRALLVGSPSLRSLRSRLRTTADPSLCVALSLDAAAAPFARAPEVCP